MCNIFVVEGIECPYQTLFNEHNFLAQAVRLDQNGAFAMMFDMEGLVNGFAFFGCQPYFAIDVVCKFHQALRSASSDDY